MDIKLYVDADSDVASSGAAPGPLERGRSVDSILRQYEDSVRPMYLEFVEPTKRFADVIIPGGGHNKVAIEPGEDQDPRAAPRARRDAAATVPQA